MKLDKTTTPAFPFSRTSTLLRVSCIALLTSAGLLANPPGHQKLYFSGESSMEGDELSTYLDNVFLQDSGAAIFTSYGTVYSGMPGSISALLAEDMTAPGGRVFSDLSVGYGTSNAINKAGDIAFYAETSLKLGGGEKTGLYLKKGGSIRQIVVHGASAPGGGLYDIDYPSASPAISSNGNYLAFVSKVTGGPGSGLYFVNTSTDAINVKRLAAIGTPAPDGGVFTEMGDTYKVLDSGIVFFEARSSASPWPSYGLFCWNGTKLVLIDKEFYDRDWKCSDSGLITYLNSYFTSELGQAAIDGSKVILKRGDPAPGGGVFGNINYVVADSTGNVAFRSTIGNDVEGIFLWTPTGVKTIALESNPPPGGGLWYDFTPYGVNLVPGPGGKVYFRTSTTGGDAIFMGDGSKLVRIIGAGDSLEGQAVERVDIYTDLANASGQIVYKATLTDDDGLFIYPYITAPEITVQQPAGSNLTDNKSSKAFGSVKVGVTSKAKTFTIKNTGTANLKGLAIITNGINASEFKVSGLGATSLAPGKKTTFNVTFKPAKKGTRKAAIHIRSNDKNENPFDINLAGEGVTK